MIKPEDVKLENIKVKKSTPKRLLKQSFSNHPYRILQLMK